jgi:protein TonB
MKPAPAKPDPAKNRQAKHDSTRQDSDSVVEASSTTRIATTKLAPTKITTTKIATTKLAPAQSVWLSPAQAETRLLRRTDPQYPPSALATHRAGNVVLEVQVAEDGSVSNIHTLSGDPLLAAAATEAVRTWRYQPYRQHDHPAQFQTDVTIVFTLPN